MRRISSHLVLTPRGFEADRIVELSDDGVVARVSAAADLDRQAGVEFFPGVLIPGFHNAHCHLELSHLRGAIPPGCGFTRFARGMRAARVGSGAPGAESRRPADRSPVDRSEEEEVRVALPAADFWSARMWHEGVSSVADVCNGTSTFELKCSAPIRYHSFCESFGLKADPGRARALCDRALALGLSASVTPHSLYSLNTRAFEEAVVPLECSPLSIHFLESEDEADLFKKRGPLWDWYVEQNLVPDFLDYGSPAERLVAQIPKYRPVMLVHNCALTQRDIDIVMGHFTAPVTWVLCPASNRHISGLVPPVDLLRKNSLRIAVGTDSLASNDTLSMVRELSLIKNIPLAEMLGWVCGDTIEPGHSPGLVVLTGVDLEKMELTEVTKSQRIL